MAYNVKDGGQEFERMVPGAKQAVCSHFVDLGMQASPWGDKPRVALCFEFIEKMTDGNPFVVVKEYFPSLGESATLRADLESWRGRPFTNAELGKDVNGDDDPNLPGFDLESIVGANTLATIVDKKKKTKEGYYNAINSLSPLMANMQKIAPSGQPAPEFLTKKAQTGAALQSATNDYNAQPSNQTLDQMSVPPQSQGFSGAPHPQSAIPAEDDLPF